MVHMGSEVRRDREEGTSEISQSAFITDVIDRFHVYKTSSIPASPSVYIKGMEEEESVEGVPFREVVGSLMWIANQTRPYIADAVRAMKHFSHDPKKARWQAACRMLDYLRGTADLGLTYSRAGDYGIDLQWDLQVFVDADYKSKATNRRSVSGTAEMNGGSLVAWFSRTK